MVFEDVCYNIWFFISPNCHHFSYYCNKNEYKHFSIYHPNTKKRTIKYHHCHKIALTTTINHCLPISHYPCIFALTFCNALYKYLYLYTNSVHIPISSALKKLSNSNCRCFIIPSIRYFISPHSKLSAYSIYYCNVNIYNINLLSWMRDESSMSTPRSYIM